MTPVEYLFDWYYDSISYTNVLVCMYTFSKKKKEGLCNLRKCIVSSGHQSRLILKYSNIQKFQLNNSFNKKVIFDIKSEENLRKNEYFA